MSHEHKSCRDCTEGCTARYTDERTSEEVRAAPYLLFCALAIVLASLAVKWLF
ncbi:MAG: hypothetical protein AB1646_16645 [Thermodesulfobacteriota bacterium]